MNASVTFHVVSKNGIQAEEIASDLFSALTVHKEELRAKGIHKVSNLSLGEEQMLRSNASIEYATVPITMSFLMQKTLRRGEIANNCRVYLNGEEIFENIHFVVSNNGEGILLETPPPAGSTLTITYVDATTLETYVDIPVTGSLDGVTTSFGLPNTDTGILGYYSLLQAIKVYDKTPGDWVVPVSGMAYVSGIWMDIS